MTPAELKAVFPFCRNADVFAPAVTVAMERFQINTPARQAAFLAQVGHESAQLTRLVEGLNYSAEGLMRTWPTRFPSLEVANRYAHKPQAIANYVYANRMHNGDEASGDGWRFRGAGPIQITGKENHLAVSLFFDLPLEQVGQWLQTPEGGCLAAAWLFKSAGCNELADKGDFDGVSDLINIGRKTKALGDALGYGDREELFKKAEKVLMA